MEIPHRVEEGDGSRDAMNEPGVKAFWLFPLLSEPSFFLLLWFATLLFDIYLLFRHSSYFPPPLSLPPCSEESRTVLAATVADDDAMIQHNCAAAAFLLFFFFPLFSFFPPKRGVRSTGNTEWRYRYCMQMELGMELGIGVLIESRCDV